MALALVVTWLVCLTVACSGSGAKPPAPHEQGGAAQHGQAVSAAARVAAAVESRKVGSMIGLNPYFTLHVTAASVPVEVYVNGGFVVYDATTSAVDETWPVNPLLISSANELSVVVTPWAPENGKPAFFDDDAIVTVTLRVRPSGVEGAEDIVVSTLQVHCAARDDARLTAGSTEAGSFDSEAKFERSTAGDVKITRPRVDRSDPEGRLLVTQVIDTPLPFPTWTFLKSEGLPPTHTRGLSDQRADYDGLLAAYQTIWTKLAARDLDGLMPMFEERNREIDQALFQPAGTTRRKLRAAFEAALSDATRELKPIKVGDGLFWIYDPAPGGKLRRLVAGDHAGAIIRFEDKEDASYMTQFPVAFRKQDGRYIVSR